MNKRKIYLNSIGKIKDNGGIRHTYTTTFLLPTVGYSKKDFDNTLLNVHLLENQPVLCVVLDGTDDKYLPSLVRCRINDSYKFDEIVDDEVIIYFNIPESYIDIYQLFIQGKYSNFPESYKNKLVDIYTHKVYEDTHFVTEYNVLYPQDYKRRQIAQWLGYTEKDAYKRITEVLTIPDMEYENYKSITEINDILNITTKYDNSEKQ